MACVPVLWVGLIVGTDRILGSIVVHPARLSATTGLLAILFVSSRRLHNVCLRFRSVLPIVLFSSRRYGCIYAIRRLSPCGIGSLVSHKSSGFALLIVSFRLSASAAGASRY